MPQSVRIIQKEIEALRLDLEKLSLYHDDIYLKSGKYSIAVRHTVKDAVIGTIRRDLEFRIRELKSLVDNREGEDR